VSILKNTKFPVGTYGTIALRQDIKSVTRNEDGTTNFYLIFVPCNRTSEKINESGYFSKNQAEHWSWNLETSFDYGLRIGLEWLARNSSSGIWYHSLQEYLDYGRSFNYVLVYLMNVPGVISPIDYIANRLKRLSQKATAAERYVNSCAGEI